VSNGFATDWARWSMSVREIPADYDGTIGRWSPACAEPRPVRRATRRAPPEIIMATVKRDNLPSHLLLGAGAADLALDDSRRQLAEATAWQDVSRSADRAQPYPAGYPADAPAS
jgi:hypothetical protein